MTQHPPREPLCGCPDSHVIDHYPSEHETGIKHPPREPREAERDTTDYTTSDDYLVNWAADRLVHVYGDSENADFIHRLRGIAAALRGSNLHSGIGEEGLRRAATQAAFLWRQHAEDSEEWAAIRALDAALDAALAAADTPTEPEPLDARNLTELDAVWADAQRVLPDGWCDLMVYHYDPEPGDVHVPGHYAAKTMDPASGEEVIYGYGVTPADALRHLIDALYARSVPR